MEAKDTVMSLEQMTDKIWAMGCKADDEGVAVTQKLRFEIIAEEQAEISFKAGEDKGKQEGFDKVVEWVKKHSYKGKFFDTLMIENEEWQAFLKERGI